MAPDGLLAHTHRPHDQLHDAPIYSWLPHAARRRLCLQFIKEVMELMMSPLESEKLEAMFNREPEAPDDDGEPLVDTLDESFTE